MRGSSNTHGVSLYNSAAMEREVARKDRVSTGWSRRAEVAWDRESDMAWIPFLTGDALKTLGVLSTMAVIERDCTRVMLCEM